MNHEINLAVLFKTLKRYWWRIALIAIAVMIAAACFTALVIPKKYSSAMEIYIINSNTSSDYTTTSLLGATSYLVNDYVSIIKGDVVMEKVCENLSGNETVGTLTPGQLRSMIKTSSSSNSSTFKLSIVDENPQRAHIIASEIAKIAPTEVTAIVKSGIELNQRDTIAKHILNAMKAYQNEYPDNEIPPLDEIKDYLNKNNIGFDRQDCISINTYPKLPTHHDSPNLPLYTALAGVVAAVVAFGGFLLLEMSSSVITTAEDVKKLLEQPLIGTIPYWSSSQGKN
jgi:capsular polysaccharide biosynthesis protein